MQEKDESISVYDLMYKKSRSLHVVLSVWCCALTLCTHCVSQLIEEMLFPVEIYQQIITPLKHLWNTWMHLRLNTTHC